MDAPTWQIHQSGMKAFIQLLKHSRVEAVFSYYTIVEASTVDLYQSGVNASLYALYYSDLEALRGRLPNSCAGQFLSVMSATYEGHTWRHFIANIIISYRGCIYIIRVIY